MKILVTGSSGFIGRNLCERLVDEGYDVEGVDHAAKFSLNKKGIKQYCDDFTKVHLEKYDTIIHLAANSGIPGSLKDPLKYMVNNEHGFNILLDKFRLAGGKRFIFTSSSSTHKMMSTYADNKKINEIRAAGYYRDFGVETIGLRLFNVTGRWQKEEAMLPQFVQQAKKNGAVFINGSLDISRDFTSCDDVCNAIVLAINTDNKQAFGETFDIGAGTSVTIGQFIEELKIVTGIDIKPIIRKAREGDVHSSMADPLSAYEQLGFIANKDIRYMIKHYWDNL